MTPLVETPTSNPIFHFVTALWGKSFTRLYLKLTVPTQLSAGNLPAMPRERSVYKIYTDSETMARLAGSRELLAVEKYVQVRFELIDDKLDLKSVPAHTAMNWCHNHAIAAGLNDGAHVIFLSPDAIWSDGSFERLVHWAEAGKKAVIHIAFRVAMRPFLHETWRLHPQDNDCSITLPPRELARLTLKHLHPFLRQNYFDSQDFSPLPSHVYWRAGENEILARGFHLHPLMVKPSAAVERSDVTIDFDYAVRACRDDEIHIVTDSDEILAIDITDSKRFANVVHRRTWTNFGRLLAFAAQFTNEHCRRLIAAKYRLHSRPLTTDWQRVERSADRVVGALERTFPLLPMVLLGIRAAAFQRRCLSGLNHMVAQGRNVIAHGRNHGRNMIFRGRHRGRSQLARAVRFLHRIVQGRPASETAAGQIASFKEHSPPMVPVHATSAPQGPLTTKTHAAHTPPELFRTRWQRRILAWNESRRLVQATVSYGLQSAKSRSRRLGVRVVRAAARRAHLEHLLPQSSTQTVQTIDVHNSSSKSSGKPRHTPGTRLRRVSPVKFGATPQSSRPGSALSTGSSMRVLGLSFDYHDASATLAVNGKIVAAADEERFSRRKHDPGFPQRAIEFCLERSGITSDQLDAVVFYEQPLLKFERILTAAVRSGAAGSDYLDRTLEHWSQHRKFDARAKIGEYLEIDPQRIHYVDHHQSHAAAAFYCSPFDSAAIVTLDGTGEFETCTVSVGRGTKIEKLYNVELPHSLGLLYSAFTAFLGFEVNEGEYKVMGMAGFGRPTLTETIRPLIQLLPDGRFEIVQDCFEFFCPGQLPYNKKLLDLLGPARTPESGFELGDRTQPPANEIQRESRYYADIAASLQACVEEAISHVVLHAVRRTGEANVCLAGGVALNSSANGKLQRQLEGRLYVHPAAGDSGGSLGAALHYSHHTRNVPRVEALTRVDLGRQYDRNEVLEAVREAQLESYEIFEEEEVLLQEVARRLARGEVVGWLQGHFEWGPRALGHRSILADPTSLDMQRVVNEKIKFRERFRPFAPAVLAERAEEFFEFRVPDSLSAPEHFMLAIGRVRSDKIAKIPAVTHVDGTARIQLVRRETNPRFYRLLQLFDSLTGVPVLLNTSFNLRGEPMVASPADALKTFSWSDMDAVVLNDVLVNKEYVL